MYHYYISNMLQRIKNVNKMWWFKLLFSKLCFQEKNFYVKGKRFVVLILFSLYSSFFNVFLSFCLFSSFFQLFSVPIPQAKKTMILSKYHSNMILIRDYYIAVSIGKKHWFLISLSFLDNILNNSEFLTACAPFLKRFSYVNLWHIFMFCYTFNGCEWFLIFLDEIPLFRTI